MPRAFKPEERELIKHDIMKAGKDLFAMHGIKKTNVEDIARAAGIAKGSFYLFFNSKEELFMDIMEELERGSKERIEAQFLIPGVSPREAIKGLLRYEMEMIEREPVFRIIMDKDEYLNLLRRLPQSRVDAHLRNDRDHNITLFLNHMSDDKKKKYTPDAVAGIMKSLFFSLLHKEEIGRDVFPQVLDLMIDLICDGLIQE
ncbi:MAG: TetR/AcrR family transcriptional regulator [Brevinematales bacterium]|nr:TetR/AcrR family transcriptional regulator [Brevinematales bacterium]